ncbi:MAG: homocysteine S-methyltransferase family protein [Hyphomonadaceae bacterium]|nr:homocysteine S-methyltransferase family protein [Hyphomonadaceae bacterium]
MTRKERFAQLERSAQERIVILDGAWGSMLQGYALTEQDFRGDRFADHNRPLKGNNDILCVTRPDIVREIHDLYLDAGADITSTNTFSATTIAQADYALEAAVDDINVAAARIAREACDAAFQRDGRVRLVAGAIGPTNKTLSLSPDVNDPARRDVTFEVVAEAYRQQARGLVEGGADVILIETIFDTLNAKAALYGVEEFFDDLGERLPIMISGTITDLSGRTLSGQTVEAFWHSIRHANPWSVGLNCALGPKDMDAHIRALARAADVRISAYPNAGLPNAMGGYDETPEDMVRVMGPWMNGGVVNIVGGCCGTTPDHIRALADAARGHAPRKTWTCEPVMRLSGLEPFTAAA